MTLRFIRYFLLCTVFLISGIIYSREVPKAKVWILNKIEIVSREKLNIEIKADKISFKFLPPGLQLQGISIKPRGALAKTISPSTVDSIEAYLNFSSLLGGRFEIGQITVDHPVTNIFIKSPDASSAPGAKKDSGDLWDQGINIPLSKVVFTNAEIRAKIQSANLLLQLRKFSFTATKNYQAAQIEVFAPDVTFKKSDVSTKFVNLGLATRVIVERNALEIAAAKITQGQSYFIARALGRGDVIKLEFPLVNGKTIAHINLNEASDLAKIFFPDKNIPDASGVFNFEMRAQQQKGKEPDVSAQIETQEARAGKFEVGNMNSTLEYKSKVIKTKEVRFENSAGKFKFQDVEAHLGDSVKVSARAVIEEIELSQFLSNIGAGSPPVHMEVSGIVPCEGTITPVMRVECAGQLNAKNFRVHNPKDKDIVALKEFSVTANLVADQESVKFPKGLITIGESKGVAQGEVSYANGFNFTYHSDSLNFADIKSLAGLKFDGAVDITGMTKGDSKAAIMDAKLASSSFWFEDFGVGDAHLGLRYEKDEITLSDIDGHFGNINYAGQAGVKLSDDEKGPEGVKGAHLAFSQLDLADLQKLFSRKVKLPFLATGLGSGDLEASGPFSLSKLSYKLKTTLKKGTVGGESFQEAHYDVHGINGHAYADNVQIKKGDGSFVLTGDVKETGDMNVEIGASNLQFADFDMVRGVASGLEGRVNFNMTMRDYILSPIISGRGHISQTTLNQQLLEDSDFDMGLSANSFKLNGQVFNQKLKTVLEYPFKENQPFKFKFDTDNWDFSTFLSVIGHAPLKRDYETDLSAHVDLESKTGGPWKSSGDVNVSRLYVRHGTSQMRNTGPIRVHFDDGEIKVAQMQLDGDNTGLTVTGGKNKKDVLNFNVNGHLDLSLLMFLTPFLRDMNGDLSISTQIGGSLFHPDLLGSAYIKRGYFKLDALPQAFEDIFIDTTFSQSRILINRLAGHLGGGNLTATGAITFKDFGNIPVELTGDLIQTTLTVPDGLSTRGDFHFGLTGNWFPYVLKGEYNISGGLYSANIGGDGGQNSLQRSVYLPNVILQKDFSPLELDINTHFRKGMVAKNILIDTEVKGDMEIKGEPSHPTLKGDIEALPGGKAFFRETPFALSDAVIKFNGLPENNATVSARGATHVRDWDITLLVSGTQKNPKIELNSSPSLPEKSIISLLALGLIDEDTNKPQTQTALPAALSSLNNSNTSQGTVQASQAGGLVLYNNPLQNELKKRFGVTVRLSQSVDDTRNIVTPQVIAEKQWTPKINTSVSRSVSDRVSQDFNIEYKLDRHFSVLGSFEQRDYDPLTVGTISTTTAATATTGSSFDNILGLNLQYQVEFK